MGNISTGLLNKIAIQEKEKQLRRAQREAEFLMYCSMLTPEERIEVEDYLRKKIAEAKAKGPTPVIQLRST